MVNSLETENRSRMKRNQHPLTYQEAYSLLTHLVGGDVLNPYHSANIHWNAYNMEEDGLVSNNHRGERNQRGNQKGGRGGRGKSSSGRGKFSNKGKPYGRPITGATNKHAPASPANHRRAGREKHLESMVLPGRGLEGASPSSGKGRVSAP